MHFAERAGTAQQYNGEMNGGGNGLVSMGVKRRLRDQKMPHTPNETRPKSANQQKTWKMIKIGGDL